MKFTLFLLTLVITLPSFAADFASYSDEKAALIKYQVCHQYSETPGDANFGRLFGCHWTEDALVKHYINEDKTAPDTVKSVKLIWVDYFNHPFISSSDGATLHKWAVEYLADRYFPNQFQTVFEAIAEGRENQTFNTDNLTIDVKIHKGSGAYDRTLLITPR